jgi:recombination protein RecR
MVYTSKSIERAVDHFSSLPGVGRKTAQRLVYHLLRADEQEIKSFANALLDLKKNIKLCSQCFNFTEVDPCPICSSHKRDRSTICVVEEPNDVLAIEKTNEYFGLYHVLHGVLNPLEGITQDELKIRELVSRVNGSSEIILALNPSLEGEVTTQFISKLIKPLEVKVSRIASGVPMGSALEFSDEATLSRALEARTLVI